MLIIFLTIAQAEESIGHVEPLRVITEEIGFGAAAGAAAGALGAWYCGPSGGGAERRRPGGRSTRWRPRCGSLVDLVESRGVLSNRLMIRRMIKQAGTFEAEPSKHKI